MAADGDPMVKALIVRLDCWLTANRPEYYAMLQSGATEAELDASEMAYVAAARVHEAAKARLAKRKRQLVELWSPAVS